MKFGPFIIGGKDGGPESSVHAWMFEVKWLFSFGLLRFDGPSRDAFHSHAFNAWSWLLSGALVEKVFGYPQRYLFPSSRLISTPRECVHKVDSAGVSWVLTFRGPWCQSWFEVLPYTVLDNHPFPLWELRHLEHGRGIVKRECPLRRSTVEIRLDEIEQRRLVG